MNPFISGHNGQFCLWERSSQSFYDVPDVKNNMAFQEKEYDNYYGREKITKSYHNDYSRDRRNYSPPSYGYSKTKVNSEPFEQRDFRKVRPFDELDEPVQDLDRNLNTTAYDYPFRRTRGNLNTRGRGVHKFRGRGAPHKISLQNRNRNPSPIKTFLESLEQSSSEFYPRNSFKDNRRSAEFHNNSVAEYDYQKRKRHYTYNDVDPYHSKKSRSSSGSRPQDRVRYRSGSGSGSSVHSQSPYRNEGFKSNQFQGNSKEFFKRQYYRSGSPSSLSSRSSSRNGRYRSRSKERSRDRRDRTRSPSSSRSRSSRRRYRSRSLSSSRFSRNSGYRSYSGQGSSDRRDRQYETRSSRSRSSSRSSVNRSNSRQRSRDRNRKHYRSRSLSSSRSPSRNRGYRSNSRQRDRREDRRYKSRSPSRKYSSPFRYRSQSSERSSRGGADDRAQRSKSRSRSSSPAKDSYVRNRRRSNERSPSPKNRSRGLQRRDSERSLSSISSTSTESSRSRSSSSSESSSRSASPNSERSRSKTPVRREKTVSPLQRSKNLREIKIYRHGRFQGRRPSRNEAFVRRQYEKYEKEKEEQMLANVDDLLGKLVGNVAEHSRMELGNATITSKEGISSTLESEYRTIQIKPKSPREIGPINTSFSASGEINRHTSSLHENLRISLYSDHERNVVCEQEQEEKKEPCSAKKRKHPLEVFDKENMSDLCTGAKKSKKILINLKSRSKLDDGGVDTGIDSTEKSTEPKKGNSAPNFNCLLKSRPKVDNGTANMRLDSTDNSAEKEISEENSAPNMNCLLKSRPKLDDGRVNTRVDSTEKSTEPEMGKENSAPIMNCQLGMNQSNGIQEKATPNLASKEQESQKTEVPETETKIIQTHKSVNEIMPNKEKATQEKVKQSIELSIDISKKQLPSSLLKSLAVIKGPESRSIVETAPQEQLPSTETQADENNLQLSSRGEDEKNLKLNSDSSDLELESFDEFTDSDQEFSSKTSSKEGNSSNISKTNQDMIQPKSSELSNVETVKMMHMDKSVSPKSVKVRSTEKTVNQKPDNALSNIADFYDELSNDSVNEVGKTNQSSLTNQGMVKTSTPIKNSDISEEKEKDREVAKHSLFTTNSSVIHHNKSSHCEMQNSLDSLNEPKTMRSTEEQESKITKTSFDELQEQSFREKSLKSAIKSSKTTCKSVVDGSDGTKSDQKMKDTSQKRENSASNREKSLDTKSPENKLVNKPENKLCREPSVKVPVTKEKLSDTSVEKSKKTLSNKISPKLSEVTPKPTSHTMKVQTSKEIKSSSKKENKSGYNSSTNSICDETLPKLVSRKDKKRDTSSTSVESSDMESSISKQKEIGKKKDKENYKEPNQDTQKASAKNLKDTSDSERKLVSRKDKKRDTSTTSVESSDMESSISKQKEKAKKKDKENHKEAKKVSSKSLTDTSDTERKQLAPSGNNKSSSKSSNKEILKKSKKQNQKSPSIKLIDQEDLFKPDTLLKKKSHSGHLKSKETKSKEHRTSSVTKDNKMKSSAMTSSKTTTKTANKPPKDTASALTNKPSKSADAADQPSNVCDKNSTDATKSTPKTDESSLSKTAEQEEKNTKENDSENEKMETTENNILSSQVAEGNDKENGRKVDEVPKISPLGGKRQSRTLSVEQLKVLEKNKEVRQRTCMELKHGHTGGRKMLKSEKFKKLKHQVHAEALHSKTVLKHGVSRLKCQSKDEGKRKVLSNLSTQKTSNESTKSQEVKKPFPKSKQSETDIIAKSILQKVPGRIEIYDTNFEKVAYSSKEPSKEGTSNTSRTETDGNQVSNGSLNLQEYRNVNEDVEDTELSTDDENLQIDLDSKSPDKRNASCNREKDQQEGNQVDDKEKATNVQDKSEESSEDSAKTRKQNITKPVINEKPAVNEEVRKGVMEETSRVPPKNLFDIELFSPAIPTGTIAEDQLDYSDIRIMYYNCGVPQSPYVAEEDIANVPTPGKIKPQREIIPSSKPGTPSKNSSPGTDHTTKKIVCEEDFPMLTLPDICTMEGQESQKDIIIPSSRPETPNVSGSTGTEPTARKILPEEEIHNATSQSESNSAATNVSNSQETETSSDYGTDSNRGTPYSDISDPSDEPESMRNDKSFVPNLQTIMPGQRNLGLNADENVQRHTDAQQVLGFLSKLRRENLENFKPIGFTHQKSFKNMQVPNPNARLTVGFLEPEKFKDPKLQCIRCNLCCRYFDPCGFLLHYDSDVMKLDEMKCLMTEPQPAVGNMEPEVRKIWDYLITLKNFLVDAKMNSLGLHMERSTKKRNGDVPLETQKDTMLDVQNNRRDSSTDERGSDNSPIANVLSDDIMGIKSVQNTSARRLLEQMLRYGINQYDVTTNQSTVTTDLPTTGIQTDSNVGGLNSLEVTNVEFVQRRSVVQRMGYNPVTQSRVDSLSTGMSQASFRAQQDWNIMPPPAQMVNTVLPGCTQSDLTRRRSLESFQPNSNNVAPDIQNTRSVSDDSMMSKSFKKDLNHRYQQQRNAAFYQQPNFNIQTSKTFSVPQNVMRPIGSQGTSNLNDNPLNRATQQNVNLQNNPSQIQTVHQQIAKMLREQNVTKSSEVHRASSLQQSVESHTRHQMRPPPPPYQRAYSNNHSTGSSTQVGQANQNQFFMTRPHLQQMGSTQIQPSHQQIGTNQYQPSAAHLPQQQISTNQVPPAAHLSQEQVGNNQFQTSAAHLSQQQMGNNQFQPSATHLSQQQIRTNQIPPSAAHLSQQQMGNNQFQPSAAHLSQQQLGTNWVQSSAVHLPQQHASAVELSQKQIGINQVQPSSMRISQQQMYNQAQPSTFPPAHQNMIDNQVPSTMTAAAHQNILSKQVTSTSIHPSQQNMTFYQQQHPTMRTSVSSATTLQYSKSSHQQQINQISQGQNNGQGMLSDRALTVNRQPVSNLSCGLGQSNFSGQIYSPKQSQNTNTQGASTQMSRSETNQLASEKVKTSPVSEACQLSTRQAQKISPVRDVHSFLQKASRKVSGFDPGCVDSESVNPSKSDSSTDNQGQGPLAQENDGEQNPPSSDSTDVSATSAISSRQGLNLSSSEPGKSKSLLESAAELAKRINGPAEVQKRVVGSYVNMMASLMWICEEYKQTSAEVTTAIQELEHCKGEVTKAVDEYHTTEELMTQKINEVLAKIPK
ncbi:uncharacterized protein LOC134242873 [Saccostrea cucullata]|uniref:uncharacterized protein LOC134242873 n=1 Tax=Saccostrea cuccullata TaxID=36930 RepID=UPI002ED44778